jgi:hypothetical protein
MGATAPSQRWPPFSPYDEGRGESSETNDCDDDLLRSRDRTHRSSSHLNTATGVFRAARPSAVCRGLRARSRGHCREMGRRAVRARRRLDVLDQDQIPRSTHRCRDVASCSNAGAISGLATGVNRDSGLRSECSRSINSPHAPPFFVSSTSVPRHREKRSAHRRADRAVNLDQFQFGSRKRLTRRQDEPIARRARRRSRRRSAPSIVGVQQNGGGNTPNGQANGVPTVNQNPAGHAPPGQN